MAKKVKRKPAKVRKPAPFKVGGRWIMQCCDLDGDRFVEGNNRTYIFVPPRDMPRLRRWLARAEAWCKQGGGA